MNQNPRGMIHLIQAPSATEGNSAPRSECSPEFLDHYQTGPDAIRRLQIDSTHHVLDIGCGDGFHSRLALENHHPRTLSLLDIDAASLARCKAGFSDWKEAIDSNQLRFITGNALELPFDKESFDRVICCLVLYMLPIEAALKEINRVIKAGGRVYLRVPALSWKRSIPVLRQIWHPREFAYGTFHIINGIYFGLFGHQWTQGPTSACYLPLRRFKESVVRNGFLINEIRIDRSNHFTPSIEAWIMKNA